MRALVTAVVVSTIAVGGLSATATPAGAITGGGGCRYPAPAGFNVTLQPCAEYSSQGPDYVHASVFAQGMPSTAIRVWMAPAIVNPDGSVTDTGYYREALYQQPNLSMSLSADFPCSPGKEMVIDSWVTDNGVRYGSIQSSTFWC